jgi:hypothetical protein
MEVCLCFYGVFRPCQRNEKLRGNPTGRNWQRRWHHRCMDWRNACSW